MGFNVEYVTSKIPGLSRQEFVREGVKYRILSANIKPLQQFIGPRESYLYSLMLSKYLNKVDFDILHTTGALIYLARNNKHKRVHSKALIEVYDLESIYDTNILKLIIKRVSYSIIGYYFLFRRALDNADKIIVEDPIQREKLIKFYSRIKNKIVYLPTGVDTETINDIILNSPLDRSRYGFHDDDFIIVSVNRFYEHKGLNYLIDAYKIIKDKIKNAKLLLIGGSGPYLPNIISQIKTLGGLKLNDDVRIMMNIPYDELVRLLAISDVYVNPVLMEGTSNSVLDAAACGLPIISTNMPWIVHNGINGFLIPPRNANAIASAILQIYDKGLQKIMGKVSRDIARRYDWINIAKIAVGIYEEVLNEE